MEEAQKYTAMVLDNSYSDMVYTGEARTQQVLTWLCTNLHGKISSKAVYLVDGNRFQ